MNLAQRSSLLALLLPASALSQLAPATPTAASLALLPQARVELNTQRHELIIELPPVDLPASTPDHQTMVTSSPYQAVIPANVSISNVNVEVVDESGRVLPKVLLHHVNLDDPSRRDLFL